LERPPHCADGRRSRARKQHQRAYPHQGRSKPALLGSAIFLSTESWSMRFRAWLTEEGRDVELALI
jgi:hypothetical protein